MLSELRKSTHTQHIPIGEAAWDVIERGHRVLLDRIDLLSLEARQAAVWAQRQAVVYLFAVLLLTTAWVAFNCTAVLALRETMSITAAAGLVTVFNAVIGGALLAWAWKREL